MILSETLTHLIFLSENTEKTPKITENNNIHFYINLKSTSWYNVWNNESM